MTPHKRTIVPVIGCAFDPDQRDEAGRIVAYLDELRYYRPRGFFKLAKEGELYVRSIPDDPVSADCVTEWMMECDTLLTEWARRVTRHDYIVYGPFEHGGAVGFYIDVDGALEDCAPLKVSDLGEVPKGYTGLVCQVSDHGNVSAYLYSRGRYRNLFNVV